MLLNDLVQTDLAIMRFAWDCVNVVPNCTLGLFGDAIASRTPCKGIRIAEFRKCLPVESGIRKIRHAYELWVLGFEIRNTVQGIRNLTTDWHRESKFHWQRIRSPVPGIQNRRLAWIAFHGAKHFSHWLLQNCAGNWVKIWPQNSSILQFDDRVYSNL